MFFVSHLRGNVRVSILGLVLAGLVPAAHAEKRVYARVIPNAGRINGTVEIYDPSAGTFNTLPSSLIAPRESHIAVLLKSGDVLIAGGYDGAYLATAELFDPGAGTFTSTGLMAEARSGLTGTLLLTGKVLVAGGSNGSVVSNTAELYDQSAGTFSATSGSMTTVREGHTSTLLSSGKVLVAGGDTGGLNTSSSNPYLNSAELYDPAAGTFTATTSLMTTPRTGHSATLLSDGRVLIAGGEDTDGYLSSAEIYDPSTDKFTATTGSMAAARVGHTATLLSDGRILIAGGYNGSYLNSAEIFDPSTGKFAPAGNLSVARFGHTATPLSSGKLLIAGGYNGAYLNSVEVFDPKLQTFSAQPNPMRVARELHATTALPNGQILVTGGQNSNLLTLDIDAYSADNISPNIILSADSKTGYVAFTGSGDVVAFSVATGQVLGLIHTGGYPANATLLKDGVTIAFVSVLGNKIFLVNTQSLQLQNTYTYSNAQFGYGSWLALSPDGSQGYVSSGGTGQVIKINMADGKELGRMSGLQAPGQITVTPDGKTLLIVDMTAAQLVFADSSSLTSKYTLNTRTTVPTAQLTPYNKAVLSSDASSGALASQDTGGSTVSGQIFIFKTSDASILFSGLIGTAPGYTALTPDGTNWVVFNDTSITLIPTGNPGAMQTVTTAQGNAVGSANIVFSPDSRYAFYASSLNDLFFQHDLTTTGVVGQVLIGDDPNRGSDEPSSVAIAPDGVTIAVLELTGNKIDLLTDVTVLSSTKYILSGAQFTGLSLLNLSGTATNFTLTAFDNYGQVISATDLTNPIQLTLPPNGQISENLGQLFAFDLSQDQVGRLEVKADQPQIAGFMTIGQIRATWLGYYLVSMDGVPLQQDVVVDWIVPEIGRENNEVVTFDVLNPNFTAQSYDLNRYGQDGTLIDQKTGNSAPLTNRIEQTLPDVFPPTSQSKVLITGGQASGTATSAAETYDITGKSFAATTGAMTVARQGLTATLMLDGRVLVAGGKNSSGVLNSAETYSITAGTFTATPFPMVSNRYRHTATLLQSGRVLLAGGQNPTSVNDSAELFDPTTNSFTATAGSMSTPRDSHTATLLLNGKVLIAGGINGNTITNTAELYDPATGKFTTTGPMGFARVFHTATLLADGRVLIAGGYNGTYLNSAEIYNPVSGTFSPSKSGLNAARGSHTATLLSDDTVLLTGGTNGSGVLSSAEIYDPAEDTLITTSGTMTSARTGHTATLIGDRTVVITGGNDGTNDLTTAEIYSPSTQTFATTSGAMTTARSAHAATLLQAGSEGYLRGYCQQGIMFTEFYGATADGAALNGINIGNYAGVGSIYAPQFATVAGFDTYLNLINANPVSDAQVTITLHAADGKVIGTPVTRALAKNAQIKDDISGIFQQNPAVNNTAGWVEIRSTVDKVLGTVTYTNADGTILASLALSGRPMTNFVFPVAAEDGTYETGIALLNAQDQAANVTMELWTPDGNIDRSATFKLQPGNRLAQYLGDYFPGLGPHLVANVRVRSDVPIHAIGLMNDRQLNFLAAIPALPIPGK